MDLLSNLDSSHWENAEPASISGLKDYTIMKCKPLDAGKFEYAVQENVEDGVITAVTLEGGVAKKNPLQSIRNVEFKVEGGKVTAVNLDGDCVKRK